MNIWWNKDGYTVREEKKQQKSKILGCFIPYGHFFCQFGEVLATTEHDEAIIISDIDYSQIELRRWITLKNHMLCIYLQIVHHLNLCQFVVFSQFISHSQNDFVCSEQISH